MKAPDKIYCTEIDHAGLYKELYAAYCPTELCDEYIRKDAILEWLESKVYEHNEDRLDDGFNTAIGQVIDKINSL